MKSLNRDEFIEWLRKRGYKSCGEMDRCPIATYLDLPRFATPNYFAAIAAAKAGDWALKFVRWADDYDYGDWDVISGLMAADFLESLP